MHADLEKLKSLGKISPSLAGKLDQLSPGRYCHHKEWGTGKVSSWNLPKKTLVIDFEAKSSHTMALDLAFKSLTLLPDDHFLVQRYEELEKLKELAKSNPVELIRVTLEGNNNQLKPEELEKNLKGSVVPAAKWKNWWDNVRSELHSKVEFAMPTRKGEAIRLRQQEMSYVESVIDDYSSHKDIKARVRVVDSAKLEKLVADKEGSRKLLKMLNEDVLNGSTIVLQQTLELAVIRDMIASAIGEDLSSYKALADILCEYMEPLPEILGAIPAVRQKSIYEAYPVAFGDGWVEQALRVFDLGGARAVGEVAKFIKEQKQEAALQEHLRKGVLSQTLQPDGLIWICRNRKTDGKGAFCIEVGSAILALIDQDYMDGGPNRMLRLKNLIMDDSHLVCDMIKEVPFGEVRQFAKLLYGSPAFPELDRKALLARMMSIHPTLQDIILKSGSDDTRKKQEPVFVSWSSLDKRKAEYEELVNVKIPQNKHNKSVFRAEGDLRENAGYQDAKEVERVLNRRRAELERDLSMARGTDFKGADTSAVSMGTIVTLESESGDCVDYTVLGAWDSDPEQHIVSYLSQAGKKLVGHKVGESVTIVPINEERKRIFTIKAIKAVNP
ncbi:GreA/GreB family elongation factor [Akkermansia sp. N21169]|uniref:GreA/GreB family elongation factor n=1 Tax=Akkermansia sp. N21169 TaxID=3040765 RepID=UPI00244EFBA9|nr:GreA/GreB family elongation factor [Akkermansia sp. N21169]MDH3069222.1 GreA/GreB family elongation factor [Akkermansia sp. N21169]